MAEKDIRHSGRIVAINPDFITVEIVSESACASCHAQSLCGMSDSKRKLVDVPATLDDWHIGEEVNVVLRRTMGFKAVWVAYVIPLIVMMAVLMVLVTLGVSELVSGLSAITSVGVYYLGVYLLRDTLRKDYSFYINKI